jgi:serine/threonine protein phosphatase PrpC
MSFLRRILGKPEGEDKARSSHREDEVESFVASPVRATAVTSSQSDLEPGDVDGQNRLHESNIDVTRPWENPNSHAAPHPAGLCVGYASDIGQLRDHNEDSLVAFQGIHLGDKTLDPFGFFVVTDGMGGHQAGEVASSLAARLVCQAVLEKIYLPHIKNAKPQSDLAPITEILRDAVQEANARVHERVPGGGTTLTCALVFGRRAYIAHVGDSRAYLLTDEDIKQITQDHSYVGRLIELGELSPEEAAIHPQRHVLYRAIGQGDGLDIDTYHQPLPPGSRLLLCSDGLSGQVSEEEIELIIASAATPQEACRNLLEAANDAGGPDNITVVLIETPPD